MKIDSTQPLQHSTHHGGGKPNKAQTSAADANQDVDHARVEEIRQAIAEGRLEVKPERIAQGLLTSVRDMLDEHDGA